MRSIALTATALALAVSGGPGSARAQSTTVRVEARATILAHLQTETPTSLDFGTVWVVAEPQASPGASAHFRIRHNSSVQVTITGLPTELLGPGGETVPVRFRCGFSPTPDSAYEARPCDALGSTGIGALGTIQETYVRVVGELPDEVAVTQTGLYTAVLEFGLRAVY